VSSLEVIKKPVGFLVPVGELVFARCPSMINGGPVLSVCLFVVYVDCAKWLFCCRLEEC
jgi:hypothetical protein